MSTTKILYVEDEPFLGKIVRETLEGRNFTVKMVEDGAKVMDSFEGFHPDICVLDVMLPNVDGFSLGKSIRERYPALPIIFLTAKNQTEDLLEGFQSGGNDYIRKPFSMEELIVRINNLLNLSQGSSARNAETNHFEFGHYSFYPSKFELHFKDQIRQLSHREAELLKIFATHINRPVERKVILKQIWGDDSFFNSRNLDVYIRKLRNYLEKDPTIQIITLKGVGYHFRVDD